MAGSREQCNESTGSINMMSIGGLRPQSPCRFAVQPTARVSKTLRPSYLIHVTAAAT